MTKHIESHAKKLFSGNEIRSNQHRWRIARGYWLDYPSFPDRPHISRGE